MGIRGAKIAEMLAKKGVKVNRVPLFKSFAILNDAEALHSVSLPEDRKFFVMNDVSGAVARATGIHEITEGNLVILSLEDDFAYSCALEIVEKLRGTTEDYTIVLAIVPQLDASNIVEVRERIRALRSLCDIMFLFKGSTETDELIFKSFNLLSLAGEIDIRRRVAGEVVIDTSDIFNSLKGEGFSIVGYAERKLPFLSFLRAGVEMKAIRTRRMLEMLEDAMRNLSMDSDVSEASSALLLYAAPPREVTMEGMFAAINRLESLNDDIVVRYGDYPTNSRRMSVVVLFSGVRKIHVA